MEGILNFSFAVRKITGSNPEACLIPLTGSDPSYAMYLIPVSYTHLDVYKRQY